LERQRTTSVGWRSLLSLKELRKSYSMIPSSSRPPKKRCLQCGCYTRSLKPPEPVRHNRHRSKAHADQFRRPPHRQVNRATRVHPSAALFIRASCKGLDQVVSENLRRPRQHPHKGFPSVEAVIIMPSLPTRPTHRRGIDITIANPLTSANRLKCSDKHE
jgi:hypothetical protein